MLIDGSAAESLYFTALIGLARSCADHRRVAHTWTKAYAAYWALVRVYGKVLEKEVISKLLARPDGQKACQDTWATELFNFGLACERGIFIDPDPVGAALFY